ncbi:MAG: Uma2 family endonuclease [Chloroflexaceae bacterium]|nr:Uma2 family endonuclease [Chloroflexaceae bacterium]
MTSLTTQQPFLEPFSDEPPLESDLHRIQIEILIQTLNWLWRDRNDYYASGNLTIYYSPEQLKSRDFRGPDFFVVLGTEKRDRASWTTWLEGGKFPNLIIEILSNSTARMDRLEKKDLYQNIFQTENYFWFHPYTLEFVGFELINDLYQPIEPTEEGYLWGREVGLYLGIYQNKLRFFTPTKRLVLTAAEQVIQESLAREQERLQKEQALRQAEQERLQKERERFQKEQALRQIESLKARLRQQGINPDTL